MVKLFLYIALFLSLVFFGFNNSQNISVTILPNILEISFRLYIILFLVFLLGYFCCFCRQIIKNIKFKYINYKQSKTIKKLQKTQQEYSKNSANTIQLPDA
jgi:uncharacterized membrane protein YciS (DUF1049 family)